MHMRRLCGASLNFQIRVFWLVQFIGPPPQIERLILCCVTSLGESQVLICGDFNFNIIDWEANSVARDGQHVVDADIFFRFY